MKIKTGDLTGAQLDWAVAKANGEPQHPFDQYTFTWMSNHRYSTDWRLAGPIIERDRIAIGFDRFCDIDCGLAIWAACKYNDLVEGYGPTPLVAAMRCFVASELGEEVEVPDELTDLERIFKNV